MLVTPFDQTDAYHLGIVDAQGKTVRKSNALTTNAEKDSYNYLTRLVFGLKKIINKLPGGESKMKSLIAALWLVKEQYQTNGKLTNALLEERFADLLKMMDNRVSLVEEEIIVKKFLEEDGIANVTGAAVSTDQPKIYPKDVKKYKQGNSSLLSMTRRPKPVVTK
jgi:hypothetical protein